MIKLQNVSKYYNSNGIVALGLRKVNLELHRNEFVAIVGESGSGKTTLLNVLSGIDSYEDGEMYVNGKETSYFSVEDMENYRKNYVAFVFQSYNLIESYTVLQNVEAPLILSGYPKEKIRSRAKEIIKKVGLTPHINHKATKLSGGQKQRVVIARALAKDCPIIAADEPTGNLDSKSAKEVIELLQEIAKEKLVIIVTHDFSQVEDYATRKIRVYDGEIVEDLELKKTDKLDLPTIDSKESEIKFRDYLGISLRNLLAVPKKTLLMLLVFVFFSFFIGLSYGSFQSAKSETNYTYNSTFVNANSNRVVLNKKDGTAFTQAELDTINGYNDQLSIVDFDYILDGSFSFYYSDSSGRYTGMYGLFMPLDYIDETDLTYGRLPQDDNELVVALREYDIENNHEDYLDKTFVRNSSLVEDETSYTVVGIVSAEDIIDADAYYSGYYFTTDETLNRLKKEYYTLNTVRFELDYTDTFLEEGETDQTLNLKGNRVIIDNTLADDEFKIHKSAYPVFGAGCELDVCTFTGTLDIKDSYIENSFDATLIYDSSPSVLAGVTYVNQNTYDKIYYDDIYQITIFAQTEIDTKHLIDNLDGSLLSPTPYNIFYPYDTEPDPLYGAMSMIGYLFQNIGMFITIFIVILGSTFITYAIFRVIINTKLPDYAIFRTIGANKKAIRRFIYIENFYIVIVSFIIFLVTSLALPMDLVKDTFFEAIKSYNIWGYFVFLILMMVLSMFISGRYCNKIFSNTVQTTLNENKG